MDWKALICGSFSGILLMRAVAMFVPPDHREQENNSLPLSRKFSGLYKKHFFRSKFDSSRSILSQKRTNIESLMEIYMTLSSAELKVEISKIDKEREGDAASSVNDAISIMFLAYRWGQLDKEAAFDYSESGSLTHNRSIEEPRWSHLLIHSWADRNPEAAYKYLVERRENTLRYKTASEDGASSAVEETSGTDEIKEDDVYFYERVLKTIAVLMGKMAPDISLNWAKEADKMIKFFSAEDIFSSDIKEWVLRSVARNHPERIPALFMKLCEGNEAEEWPTCLYDLYFPWRCIDEKAADLWLNSLKIEKVSNGIKQYILKEEVLSTFDGAVAYWEKQKKMKGSSDFLSEDYNPDIFLDKCDILEKFATREPGKTFRFMESVYGGDKELCSASAFRYFTPRTRAEAFRMLKDLERQKLGDNCSLWGYVLWDTGRYLGYEFKDMATLSRICSQSVSFDFDSVKGAIESWYYSSGNSQEMEKWIQSSELTEKDKNKCRELWNRFKKGNNEESDPFL